MEKVRLTETEAKNLQRSAKRRNTTESDVVREALHPMAVLEARQRNIQKLIDLIEPGEEWIDPDYEVKW